VSCVLSFAKEPRNLVLGMATDGFLPFSDDKKYSVWPLVFTTYNLPPSSRYKLGLTSCVGIIPGTHDPDTKVNIQPFLEIFVDECHYLEAIGWPVYDKYNDEHFTCRVKLLQIMSDYRQVL
jgi:Transposase family tnp2